MPRGLDHHATPIHHLRGEALRTQTAMVEGRLAWAMGEGLLRIIRAEVSEILERNRELANGRPKPLPFKFSTSAGRPRKPKPAKPRRSYVKRQLMPPHVFREVEEHPLEPWLANEGEAEG